MKYAHNNRADGKERKIGEKERERERIMREFRANETSRICNSFIHY